jgi:cytochrome c biogenesis protein CcmG/thiol:disulfide interchange protein DsbE
MRHNAEATPGARRSGILLVMARRALRHAAVAAIAVAAAVALGACGAAGAGAGAGAGATPRETAAARATAARRLARAPAALRANAADADTLVGEGADGLRRLLATLRGHPVVVNQWASWCGPCRAEFPLFADATVQHGARVAFVGVDFMDDRGAANQFLRASPPGFASVYDPKGEAARSLGGGRVAPTTFFIGPDGSRVHTKLGGYPDAAALEADIRRYALVGRPPGIQ